MCLGTAGRGLAHKTVPSYRHCVSGSGEPGACSVHTSAISLCSQSLMLAKAKEEWDQEIVDKQAEKERYLSERVTPLHTSGLSLSQLQVFLRPEGGGSSLGAWRGFAHCSPVSLAPRTCAGSCTRRWKLWMRRDTTLKRNATITPGR